MKRPNLSKIAQALASTIACFGGGEGSGRTFSLDEVNGPRTPRGNAILPVLFDGGVGNLARTHVLSPFGDLAPWVWHTYFNDFDALSDFNNITATTSWAVNTTGTPALTLPDGDGSTILLTNSAADDDRLFYQKKPESFRYEVRKPLLFGARFKISEAIQSDFVMGLQITDTTPLAVSDGIWFQKDDGDALLDFHIAKGSAQTDAIGVATVVTDTFLTVAFAYDGEKLFYGVNGRQLGSVVLTNAPDTEDLTISFGIQNGEAVAKTMTVDYIFASKFMGTTRP